MPGLDVAADLGAAAADRHLAVDVHGDAADGVDQRLEALEVDQHPVVDDQPGRALDRFLGGLGARIRHARIEVLVLGRVGVDRVQHAGVIAALVSVGELLVQRRILRERGAFEVARQADQHRATGLGIHAGHRHAVRPQPDPGPSGVPAQQQDVVATLLDLFVPAAGEDGAHHVPLRRDHRRRCHQAAGHTDRQTDAEHREGEPMTAGQVGRPGDPPRVDEQDGPAHAQHDQGDLDQPQHGRGGEQVDGGAPPDQREQADQQRQHPQSGPGPQGEPTHALVARRHLRRSGQHQGHAQEGERATQLDALAALLRGSPGGQDVGDVRRGAIRHLKAFRSAVGKSLVLEVLVSMSAEVRSPPRATPGRAAFLKGLPHRPG